MRTSFEIIIVYSFSLVYGNEHKHVWRNRFMFNDFTQNGAHVEDAKSADFLLKLILFLGPFGSVRTVL